jgi:transcriptional regulator with XRE-family HTH domain
MMTNEVRTKTVAEFLTQQIRLSGKSQAEIATELGYQHQNIITMFKQGRTRIPLDKVGPLAKALEIDPALLLQKVMGEYMPETLAALQSVLEGLQLTQNERELIAAYRATTKGKDVSAVICDKQVVAVVMVD